MMRFTIRTIIVLAIVWIALLLTGYGVLIGSNENVGGLGLQCKYLTARGTSTAQYVHSDSGIIGLTDCPLLRKSKTVVDNG
jgi:YobH-like protein